LIFHFSIDHLLLSLFTASHDHDLSSHANFGSVCTIHFLLRHFGKLFLTEHENNPEITTTMGKYNRHCNGHYRSCNHVGHHTIRTTPQGKKLVAEELGGGHLLASESHAALRKSHGILSISNSKKVRTIRFHGIIQRNREEDIHTLVLERVLP
jgi:hypothetical protein